MDKNLNRFVSVNMAKDMANKHRKRYSTSLVIWEMQTKTAMRYHFISIRMAKIKR